MQILTQEERHYLNSVQVVFPGFADKWHIQKKMHAESHDALDWMKDVALQGFPGMKNVSHEQMEQGKPPSFKGSDEEWIAQMFVDEPFDYDARKDACLIQAHLHFEKMVTKLDLELSSPCMGTASQLKNTCSIGTEGTCPEGSACGVVSQSDPKLLAVTSPLSVVVGYGVVGLIGAMFGHPGLPFFVPGLTETSLVLGSFFARTGHNCACEPQACEWSDQEQSCSPKKHAELSLPGTPFVGFKCVVESNVTFFKKVSKLIFRNTPSCELTACEGGDYEESFPTNVAFRGQQLHGRLGKVDRETFNCWGLRSNEHKEAKTNFELGAIARFEVYKGIEKSQASKTTQSI